MQQLMNANEERISVFPDTMVLVDAVLCPASLEYCRKHFSGKYRLCVSSIVAEEAIRRLQKIPFNYPEEKSRMAVQNVIEKMDMEIEYFESGDIDEGDELIEKYTSEGIDCHYPDSAIIAHSKRIRVGCILTRDRAFREVAEKEGIEVYHFPSIETIVSRLSLKLLFRKGRWSNEYM